MAVSPRVGSGSRWASVIVLSGSRLSGSRAGRQAVMCSCRRSMNRAPSPVPSGWRMFPGACGRTLPGDRGQVVGERDRLQFAGRDDVGDFRVEQELPPGASSGERVGSGRRTWRTGSRRSGVPGASRAIQAFLTFAHVLPIRDRWALKHTMRSPVPGLVTSRAVIRAMPKAVPAGLAMRSLVSQASRLPSVSIRSVSGSRPSSRSLRPGEAAHELPGGSAEDPVGCLGAGAGAERDVVGERAGGLGRRQQRRVPDADHQRRHEGAAALVAAPQALAVDSHDTLRRRKPEFGAQRRLKPGEHLGHLLGIEQTEEATEAVVARRAMRQVDDLRQLGLVGGGEIGNVDAGLGPTQSRRERNEQHRRQIVTRVEVARIAHLVKNGDQRLQYRPFFNQEAYANQLLLQAQQTSTQPQFPCSRPGGELHGQWRSLGPER